VKIVNSIEGSVVAFLRQSVPSVGGGEHMETQMMIVARSREEVEAKIREEYPQIERYPSLEKWMNDQWMKLSITENTAHDSTG
jgi:hypothetical protein